MFLITNKIPLLNNILLPLLLTLDKIYDFSQRAIKKLCQLVIFLSQKNKYMEIFNFFIKQIEKKIWFKVFLNYIFIFLLIISELLFLSNFFLLVNSQSSTVLDNNLINQINVFILNSFNNFSYTEILLIFLIFFLILKNILNLYQVYFQFSFIYKLTAEKASKLLKNYLNKNYEDFLKKDISIYIKQTTRDIEYVFAGIFGLIISIVGDVVYISALILFSLSIVDIYLNLEIIFLLIIFCSSD